MLLETRCEVHQELALLEEEEEEGRVQGPVQRPQQAGGQGRHAAPTGSFVQFYSFQ
jgi:hypothetical protein